MELLSSLFHVLNVDTIFNVQYTEYIPKHHHLGQGILKQLESKEDRASLMALQWKLYKLYMRNELSMISF